MERKLSEETLKEFLIIQQKEIDGAVIYQKLQTLTDDEELKAAFREASADEGCHAAILKGFTNKTLVPEENAGEALLQLAAECGLAELLERLSKAEYSGYDMYAPYAREYPELRTIMADEVKHGDSMAAQAKRLLEQR